ncbi:hypothetical protein E2C01_025269 [Portunus trituberculatus]|uniref:CCHC-type domain-containing protein n=1 Tax=Portunus trituberculatus TaxID=210409 RepID=A0A5B7EEP7_PORTR|nr:hypothetical protein [Portunus trituberculatus]
MSRKVVMGLSDRNMKAEVLQCFPCLTSVSDVVNQCEIIEAADKVAERRASGNVAALTDARASTLHPPQAPNHPATEMSAVNHQRRAWSRSGPGRTGPGRSQKRCKGCGDSGCGGTDKCPARDATCRNCGRKGHFWHMCHALTPGRGPATSNAVIVGGMEVTADLSVRIVCPWPQAECCTTAVADTRAQVCITGRPLLESLGIPPGQLHASPRTVNHVASGGVKLLGSLTCEVTVGAITTSECVYIAEGVQRLYLSLRACRALQLVPQPESAH